MTPQLSQVERKEIRRLVGRRVTSKEILKTLTSLRAKHKLSAPDITSVRRAMKGKTHRQDVEEARGRPRKHTRRNVLKMAKTRKNLIAKAEGEYEVHWKDVMKKSRVATADATTVARYLLVKVWQSDGTRLARNLCAGQSTKRSERKHVACGGTIAMSISRRPSN